jgi:hypothetical protein
MVNPAVEVSALAWSITAMRDVTERLPRVKVLEPARAFAVIGEAVWWATIVDATLVRHHPEDYDGVLAGHAPPERLLIEETMAGLRFVRNQMGYETDHVDFICQQAHRSGRPDGRVTAWTWKSMPAPQVSSLPPRGAAWELTRHRAYEARLANHTIGETFRRSTAFLTLAAAKATSAADVTSHTAG